jgi:hypothetical protein
VEIRIESTSIFSDSALPIMLHEKKRLSFCPANYVLCEETPLIRFIH